MAFVKAWSSASRVLAFMARNRYSVPCELAGLRVSTHLYPKRISVVAADAIIASYERLTERNQIHYDWQHYIPLIERKPEALRDGAPFSNMLPPLKRLKLGLEQISRFRVGLGDAQLLEPAEYKARRRVVAVRSLPRRKPGQ
jgi:hypothetical protein